MKLSWNMDSDGIAVVYREGKEKSLADIYRHDHDKETQIHMAYAFCELPKIIELLKELETFCNTEKVLWSSNKNFHQPSAIRAEEMQNKIKKIIKRIEG